jgi:hypothetical protein
VLQIIVKDKHKTAAFSLISDLNLRKAHQNQYIHRKKVAKLTNEAKLIPPKTRRKGTLIITFLGNTAVFTI